MSDQHESSSSSPVSQDDHAADPQQRRTRLTPGRTEFVVRPSEKDQIGVFAFVKNPRRGEEGVLDVCRTLVAYLKKQGVTWSEPYLPTGQEEGVDCFCDSLDGLFKIQVTRAVRDTEFFATLGKHKSVTLDTTNTDLAKGLWESIEHKANRTPSVDRPSIVLVMDAFEIHFPKDSSPLKIFVNMFGERVKALGFHSIWLVGGHSSFVTQLA
jgi:hypothetical protein